MKTTNYSKNKISSAVALALLTASTTLSSFAYAQEEVKKAADEVEVIEVYGAIRKSFEGSVGLKRTADTVIDAITAEDIGQFSDDSIAGAIQRIPGVQVETDDSGTQGDRVSIRGLGPQFVNSTINGRRLLSAGTEASSLRQMNFNVFPANVLGSVQVAKGQTAERPESGLAGQVDLQTLRPLSIGKLDEETSFATVSIEGRHQDITDENGFRVNAIVGARNEEETLGGYLAVVLADEKNARDQIRVNSAYRSVKLDHDGDGVSDETVTNVRVPTAITLNPIRETPKRVAIATGLQYKPNEDVNINWDLMYSEYKNDSRRQTPQIQMGGSYGSVFDMSDTSNPGIIIDENNVAQYINYGQSTGGGVIRPILRPMVFDNTTENLITGVNIDYYISDNLSSNFDFYYSSVDYSQDLRFPQIRKNADKSQFIYDATGTIPLIEGDMPDADGYAYFQSIIREIELEAENMGGTAKFNYTLDDGAISSIDFGLHYDVTDIDKDFGSLVQLRNPEMTAELTAAGLPGTLIDQDFLPGDNFTPSRWLYTDYDAIAAIETGLTTEQLTEDRVDPTSSYEMTESIFAIYAQANIDTELFDRKFTGNVGLRAVHTDQDATAAQFVDDVAEPVTTEGDYWAYLPSVNLSLSLQEDLILRLGMSKTLTRPDYQVMAPLNTVRTPAEEEGDEDAVGNAKIGNPKLDPMTSTNMDLTLEWYTENDGAFIASIFHKDVKDFVFSQTEQEVTLDNYDGLYNVTTYVNYSDGEAQGYEIGLYQPFDKIFPALAGFGVSANYTYVDSSFDLDTGDSGFGFPGASQDNFNFIAFYDQDEYSVRMAYVYRSDFFRQLAGTGAQVDTAIFTEAQGKLDLSVILRPMEDLSLRFNASNLTGENRRDFIGHKTTFLDYYDRGRTYSVTATYNF
jgi:iron complex outermembrane recepter protein